MSAESFEQPLVSVDVVPLHLGADGTLRVTLGPRQFAPHLGEPALPGVLMGRERSVEAAARALRTKTGIEAEVLLRDVGVFDSPARDPRGPTMAVTKLALGPARDLAPGPPALAVPVAALGPLPFDHAAMIAAAVRSLAAQIWQDREMARALLGAEFTTRTATALQRELEQAAGQAVRADASNMKRRLLATGWVRPTDRVALPEGATGRPSTVWEWEPGTA
ncbi:NUDIX hydrolase [Brachybacterium sp. YJGR34]|uniref:NUDIX hydrolase n=1 Tax=Brachybacterium sp. YJGR34 TaxID=2059911 RepID=UPI000E0AE3EF|nr:NUDIX hydrolase [Brachybacterium sp. YJGR34]